MNKTIILGLIGMLLFSLSALAAQVPVGYQDKSCEYKQVTECVQVYHCYGHPGVCIWVPECSTSMKNVCTTNNKETTVNVPETDMTPVNDRLGSLEARGDKTGWNGNDIWRLLTGETERPQGITFIEWLQGKYVTQEKYNADMLKNEEVNTAQNERIFKLESALGMTVGYAK